MTEFVDACSFLNKYVVAQNGSINSNISLFHVGVVLDLKLKMGEIAESCISMALSNFYEIHANYTTRIVLHAMDSEQNPANQQKFESAHLLLICQLGDLDARHVTVPHRLREALHVRNRESRTYCRCKGLSLENLLRARLLLTMVITLHVPPIEILQFPRIRIQALYLMKVVKVQAIIGPQESTQASFVIELGEKAQVPIVSFSATSPSLSPLKSPYFIRTAIDDSTQVKAVVSIIQAFEWKEVVLTYEDTNYGNEVIPYFIDAFQKIDVLVSYKSTIPLDATDDQILKELHNLTTMPTRVYIVHMSSSVGSRLFMNANNAGMKSQGYAWIVTDGLSRLMASMNSSVIDSMEGVLGVRPYIPKSKKLGEFKVRWKRNFYSNNSYGEISEPSLYGIWAYDIAWALAMAVEGVRTMDPQFLSSNTTNNLTDLSSLGYSTIGPQLLQTILSTRFNLVNGQLESSAFQIFDVIGEGERVVGHWTPMGGISRQLNTTNNLTDSGSMSNLKAIVWPGDSTTKPKGWVIPTNSQERLKVLVPVKTGFSQFVSMERDNITNETINITGFCIEVFSNITSRLPFGLPYEFLPYTLNGTDLESYDDLMYQIYLNNFDAAVGDVSILFNRSNCVDFTLPYTDSGVTMVVAMQDNLEKELWLFLTPLSLKLWLVTLGGFVYIGVVVWILEHKINPEFGNSRRQQLQSSIWFSFLTLVFAQREKIESNLTRLVLFTWVFFVLILTQSYTASLSSTLTVRQLQPTITDVNVLKSNGYYVGYQGGSFVGEFLTNYLQFDKSKLKSYGSPEEYHYALSNGSGNGGVAAIFDEIPYTQVFLNMYCNQYTMVGHIYSSEGFGFVFPKGSPLVPYMSRAILNLTDDGILDTIRQGISISMELSGFGSYLTGASISMGVPGLGILLYFTTQDLLSMELPGLGILLCFTSQGLTLMELPSHGSSTNLGLSGLEYLTGYSV
ncbi:glutamate receptor 2.8-like [Telopea speciosissima]|uniref:glutamate receptor 2.8-like n=1 Tax=Telopea speciosissima TaxID=54955 RepID=UPI001CC67977|nr:glutamate receptor 2.8-like [Telopea speciosissima]